MARIYEMLQSTSQGAGGPRFLRASDLAEREVPDREWHVDEMLPARQVTMLSGDGGVGKSLLGLQLAVATVSGVRWVGRDVAPGRAVYLSAEDEEDELHRRLAEICTSQGMSLGDLDALTLLPLAGEDALLATLDRRSNALIQTPLFDCIEEFVARDAPALLVLDTLADLHSGEENSRGHARQFIALLRGLAMRRNVTILLLAHPSLTGINSGSGLSGSTAWNASVRSRLYLHRVMDDGYEPDPDARILTSKKSNYARTGFEIRLRWRNGVLEPEDIGPASGLDRMAATAKAERVFMALLRQFTAEGRTVNHAGGPNYAPGLFAKHPGAEGVTRRAFAQAMEVLFGRGVITVESYGPPSRGTKRIVEVQRHE